MSAAAAQALEKVREAVSKLPDMFHDKLTVHTAPSGTQYVDAADILLNEDVWREMELLDKIVTNAQQNRP
jgi:hypothetical protein